MRNININKVIYTAILLSLLGSTTIYAQKVEALKKDTVAADAKDEKNMMLNASRSTGPRTVNIGLPAGVGGTSVMENGLPVSYFYWPVLPTRAWRLDASTIGFETLNLNQTALRTGDVGISIATYDNLGTDRVFGNFDITGNHYGLMKATGAISAPINKNGLSFAAGFYLNYDPGTLDVPFKKYYNDQTQMFKGALTQKYNGGRDKISVMYKYMNTGGISLGFSPFYYNGDGSIKEIPGVKIGRSSFFEKSGKVWMKDVYSGNMIEEDMFDQNKWKTHELYLIGENKFDNNWNLNYTFKLSQTKGSQLIQVLLGAHDITGYSYMDGTPVKGNAGIQHWLFSNPEMTIKTLSGVLNLNKKTNTHDFNIGLMGAMYNPGEYYTKTSTYYTDVKENPSKVVDNSNQIFQFDQYGQIKSIVGNEMYNIGTEYDSGYERKLALYFSDKWNISPNFNVGYGARVEWQKVKGTYAPRYNKNGDLLSVTARNADGTLSKDKSKYKAINDDYLNLVFNADALYKLTNSFGLLADAGYNRQSPHLESYAGQYEVDAKQNTVLSGGLGLYFNHPLVELVSKGTFISKNNYVGRMDLKLGNESANTVIYYDIQTLGWTTDFMFTPFKFFDNSLKNFNLHFLVTLQDPVYKNYSINPKFPSGAMLPEPVKFDDKNVLVVSKFLLEIDPSYSFGIDKNTNARVWLSGRYYSKQYANLPNNLYYKGHWETFGGLNINYKGHFDFYANFVNLLNQEGIGGTIGGTDLYNQEQANAVAGTIQGATYIRPFTAEFGVKYRF